MRLAVPLLGTDVAPRFCSAARVLIVEHDGGVERSRERVALPPGGIPARLVTLTHLGVSVLLCGGFNRAFRPMAERLGLRVEWRLVGPADAAIAAFLSGSPLPSVPRCPRAHVEPEETP